MKPEPAECELCSTPHAEDVCPHCAWPRGATPAKPPLCARCDHVEELHVPRLQGCTSPFCGCESFVKPAEPAKCEHTHLNPALADMTCALCGYVFPKPPPESKPAELAKQTFVGIAGNKIYRYECELPKPPPEAAPDGPTLRANMAVWQSQMDDLRAQLARARNTIKIVDEAREEALAQLYAAEARVKELEAERECFIEGRDDAIAAANVRADKAEASVREMLATLSWDRHQRQLVDLQRLAEQAEQGVRNAKLHEDRARRYMEERDAAIRERDEARTGRDGLRDSMRAERDAANARVRSAETICDAARRDLAEAVEAMREAVESLRKPKNPHQRAETAITILDAFLARLSTAKGDDNG